MSAKLIRILVVDDEPSIVKLLRRVLEDAGYGVATAEGGPEALAVWRRDGPFDLLLTDVMMPRISGGELAGRIRQHEPDLKVVYLTGHSDRLFKEKGALWEYEAFLDKPCSVKGLLEAVSMMLFGHLSPESQETRSVWRRLRSFVAPRDKAADRH